MNCLQWLRVQCTAILFLGLAVATAYGQLPGSSNASAANQRESARLERFYEQQLKEALSNYYTEESYLVDAKVDLQKVRVPKGFKRSTQREEPVGLEQLPGLPILPQGFSRTVKEDTVKPERYTNALKIRQKTIRVIVDTSYTYNDITFVEELVRSEANLDATRGDLVKVDQKAFPRSKNKFTERSSSASTKPKVDTARADTAAVDKAREAGFFRMNNPRLLRYIIYGLLAFVLLLVLALFLSGRRSDDEQEEPTRSSGDQQAFDELKAEIKSLKQNGEPDEEEQEVEITPERRALFEKDRSYITNQYISRPQKVANLLEKWIKSDPDEGVLKAAKAVKGGNPKLLTTLRPVLEREHFDALQYCIEDMRPMTAHEQMKQARQFRKALQEVSVGEEEQGDADHDMFNFMKQLSDDQILHLFKDESDDMIAIALAQLEGDRSAEILQLLDEKRRTSILVKMGNIDDLSIDAYKEVANHFSEKALKIINMKYVAADGVQSILKLIDTLPVSQQEQYVQSIAESDLELAQKVRKYFVGFSDIPGVEDQVLEESLNELETETLILALMGADDEIYDTIMEFRPRREQQLIKSEIETRTDTEHDDIDEARKKLLQKIRNKTKQQSS